VLDFGIAKRFFGGQEATLTGPGSGMGTAGYSSPEQWRGERVDHRTDVFALGVIAYLMLTGRKPYDPREIQQAASASGLAPSSLGPAVDAALAHALEMSPARRCDGAGEFISELSRALGQPRPDLAPRPPLWALEPTAGTRSIRATRTRPARLLIVTAAGLVLGALVAVLFWRQASSPSPPDDGARAPSQRPDGPARLLEEAGVTAPDVRLPQHYWRPAKSKVKRTRHKQRGPLSKKPAVKPDLPVIFR
jgi:serine/threonine-protein kinase